MNKILIAITGLLSSLLVLPTTQACSALGPNTHLGMVSAIDVKKQTFTLIDAETQRPITFTATPTQLNAIQSSQRITVTFEKSANALRATAIDM